MKKGIRFIAFILILIMAVTGTYRVLSWKDTSGDYLSSTQQLYATEDNLMDVIFVGSSHVYCGINPSYLWDEYGISAFDMAISGQDKDSSYHTIKEALKTQSPQVVCVDLYGLLFEKHAILGNEYRNMLSMEMSENSIKLVQNYVDEKEAQMDYILRWPIVHTRYRELTKYDFIQYAPSIYGRGYAPNYTVGISYYPQGAVECTESEPLSESNKEWLDKLIQLSEENNFKLVMFLAPMYLEPAQQKILNGAYEYLSEHGIDTLDFNMLAMQIGLDYDTDFCDSVHLNRTGSDKLTAYFGEYLVNHNQLADHRGDEAYYLWDECSKWVAHLDFAQELKQETDWKKFTEKVAEYNEDMTVIVSLDGTYQDSTLGLQAVTDIFGIPESEYYIGGKWIFKNGECVYYMDPGEGNVYGMDLSAGNVLWMENDPGKLSQVQINGEPMGCAFNGLTIVVYDNITHQVVDKRGFY